MHPINLALRFLLEISTLAALGFWGSTLAEGPLRLLPAILLPLLAAAVWGTFAVKDDPSRSGKAPVPVPGIIRLIIELGFFAWGILALRWTGLILLSWLLCGLVVLHHLLSPGRIGWLIRKR